MKFLSHFFYPPLCFFCETALSTRKLLCERCKQDLELNRLEEMHHPLITKGSFIAKEGLVASKMHRALAFDEAVIKAVSALMVWRYHLMDAPLPFSVLPFPSIKSVSPRWLPKWLSNPIDFFYKREWLLVKEVKRLLGQAKGEKNRESCLLITGRFPSQLALEKGVTCVKKQGIKTIYLLSFLPPL